MKDANIVHLHDRGIRGSRGGGTMGGRGRWGGPTDRCRASVHIRVSNSCATGVGTRLELSVPEATPRLVTGSRDDSIICAEEPDLGQVFSIFVLPAKHQCVRYSCPRLACQSFWVRDGGSATTRAGIRRIRAGIPCWQDPGPSPGANVEDCL